ncbi:XRE family transcriptional regulator [Carnobacterium maltaromaticum]|uniref:XRE family transcriptional regulator n=1 Tax=Carnobacterium maltaromaticum TaxID=2751 RepID=UPI00069117C1|nr:XRE family transcriptional regulator [Carnobacterium maltaromaticum]KRN66309.1 phage repressor like XRE family transcriptional regulator [Carnobacterium maltaromaticum DSM 20342]
MNDISSRIKYALKYRNVKAKELSEMTGISRSSISEWLSGKYEPKQDKIFIIANALNVDEAWLLGLDVPIERKSTITSIYNELEPPRQKVVYKFAERQLQEQNKKPKVVHLPIIEDDEEIEILSGHESAAGFAILGDDSNMTSTVMKASKVPNGADEVVVIKGNSMEPLIMDGEQVFIRHQPSVENGEIAIVAILDDGITCKKVYYDDAEGTVTLESVNDDYEDMVFPVEDIRIIGKVLGK